MKQQNFFLIFTIFLFCFIVNINAQDNSQKLDRDVISDRVEMKVQDNSPKLKSGETIVEGTIGNLRSSLTFEGFEGVTFPPVGWARVIVAGGVTDRWLRVTNVTGYGMSNGAAQYNFFGSSAGDIQYLQTPNFAATLSGEILQFDYAYSTWTGNERDTLIIQVSPDGVNYTNHRIFYGDTNAVNIPEANNMITAPRGATIQDHQWSTMRIALPVGTTSIRFLAISGFGNNLFLDNISTYVPSFGAPMTGAYTINPSLPPSATNFQTFASAESNLYDRGISGTVSFQIAAGTYTERFFIRKINGSSSTNTVTFMPASNTPDVTLNVSNAATTNSTTDYGIALIGCEWVRLEKLKIYDVGTTTGTYINRGIVIGAYAGKHGANNILIDNCEIGLGGMFVGGTVQGVSAGIIGSGAINGVQSSTLSHIHITNCKIDNADRGIGFFPFLGTGTVPYPGFNNINVSNNTLGSIRALGMTLTGGGPIGIIIQATSNANCVGNIIDTLRISAPTSTTSITGIAMQISSGLCSRNRIRNMTHANLTSTTPILTGIQAGPFPNENTLLTNNTITGITRNWTGAATATRLIYGIQATNFVTGISPTSTLLFINNSIYLSNPGDVTYTTGAFRSFGSGLPVIIYNNLFWNGLSSSNATAKHYAIMDDNATRLFLDSDYNDLYVSGTNSFVGRYNNLTDALTLSDWRTATVDANSVTGAPVFSSLSNLSLDVNNSANWVLNGNAIPTGLVTTDIMGNSRSTTIAGGSTDIGAYEFNMIAAPPVVTVPVVIEGGGGINLSLYGKIFANVNVTTQGTLTTLNAQYYPGEFPPNSIITSQNANAYWDIFPNGGAAGYTYNITLMYTPALLGEITTDANIRMAKSNNNGVDWTPYLTAGTGPGQYQLDLINKNITVHGLTSLSLFSLTDSDQPLPVDLISFNAEVDRNNVTLKWATAWEENNMRFDVQRKTANSEESWNTIGSVAGSGTVYEERNYSFSNKNLATGKYEYRLVQIDYDGNSTADHNLSQAVEVGIPTTFALAQNYPNPFNPTTKIDFQIPVDGFVKISIFDMSGREVSVLVNEAMTPGYYTYDFNGSNLSSGIYFYRLVTSGSVITKKMMMVK